MSATTFENMRAQAYRLLGDAQDWLRSDWRPGTGPNLAQGMALVDAMEHIAAAKAALNRAANARDRSRR